MPRKGLGTILAVVSNPGCSPLPVPIPLQMKHLVPASSCSCEPSPKRCSWVLPELPVPAHACQSGGSGDALLHVPLPGAAAAVTT